MISDMKASSLLPRTAVTAADAGVFVAAATGQLTSHFFVEDAEDFYPTPSEDIWKKFQLLPTPPRSPEADRDSDEALFAEDLAEKLLRFSDSLADDLFPDDDKLVLPADSPLSLRSKLIQDCMWSGSCTPVESSSSSSSNLSGSPADPVKEEETAPAMGLSDEICCVDPSTVFPYTLNDTKSFSVPTPSDSEEEIDVVTVDKMHHQPNKYRVYRSSTAIIQDTHNYAAIKRRYDSDGEEDERPSYPPRSASHPHKRARATIATPGSSSSPAQNLLTMAAVRAAMQQHSYTLTAVRAPAATPGRPAAVAPQAAAAGGSRGSSRAGSDSEDPDKRTVHNVLERKRRNDLKTSFLTLRDHVPEITAQERAPKVVILQKATKYIRGLEEESRRLESRAKSERKRQRLLLERLNCLKHGGVY